MDKEQSNESREASVNEEPSVADILTIFGVTFTWLLGALVLAVAGLALGDLGVLLAFVAMVVAIANMVSVGFSRSLPVRARRFRGSRPEDREVAPGVYIEDAPSEDEEDA